MMSLMKLESNQEVMLMPDDAWGVSGNAWQCIGCNSQCNVWNLTSQDRLTRVEKWSTEGFVPSSLIISRFSSKYLSNIFCKYWKRRSIQDLHESRGTGTVQKFAVQFVHCVLDGSGLSFSMR